MKNNGNGPNNFQTGGIDEESPNSPVDTYEAWGTGRFNNVNDAIIHFMLTDAGEPGKDRDEIWVVVYVGSVSPANEVLRVGGDWDAGHNTMNSLLTPAQRDAIVPNGKGLDITGAGAVDDKNWPKNGADIQNGNQQAHKGL
ncbi:MAG: hypothetical protein EXQ56_08335 [Acidobacteria bacterium]|nr:hypothetical protein [Acidobacteriota bacterium]